MPTKRKYRTSTCHNTKTAAKKAQKILHGKGMTAKVLPKNKDGKICVVTAGKRKNVKRKK